MNNVLFNNSTVDIYVNSLVEYYQSLPISKLKCYHRYGDNILTKQVNWFVDALHNGISTHYLKKILHAMIITLSHNNLSLHEIINYIKILINDRLGLD